MKNNFLTPILFASLLGTLFSLGLNIILPVKYHSYHWYYSLGFFILISTVLNIIYIQETDAKTFLQVLMSSMIGRLLAASIAFLVYSYFLKPLALGFSVHFVTHYFTFTTLEIIYLVGLIKAKNS